MSLHVPDAYNKYHNTTLIDNWVEENALKEVSGDIRRTTLKGNAIRTIEHRDKTLSKDYISVDHSTYIKPNNNKEYALEEKVGPRQKLDETDRYNTARNILQTTQLTIKKETDVMNLHSTYRDDFVPIDDKDRPPLPKRLTQDLKPAHYDPSLMTYHGLRQMPCTKTDNELNEELPDVSYDKETPITFWTQHLAEGDIPISAPEGANPFGRSSTFTNEIFDSTKVHSNCVDLPTGYVSGINTNPTISAGNNLTLKPILEDYRHRFLEIAGISGIIGIRNIFKQHETDKSRRGFMNQHEFHLVFIDLQLQVTQADLQLFFATFDKNRTGYINYNVFLDYFNLPISDKRKEILRTIFGELSNHSQSITLPALVEHFDVYRFPSVKSKQVTPSFVNNDFKSSWSSIIGDSQNITEENFIEYFSSYSSLLGDDKQFSKLLYDCFELEPPAPPKKIKIYAYDIKGKLTKIDFEDIDGIGEDPLVIQHYLRTKYNMKNLDHVKVVDQF